MTTSTSVPIRQIALGDIEQELAQTRRVLERVPDGNNDWVPHAKSTPIGRLATHIATLPRFFGVILTQEGMDFAKAPPRAPQPIETTAERLTKFDELATAARVGIAAASDEALMTTWTLRNGEQLIFSGPRHAVIRTMALSHLIHHRAQLGVYLRLLGIPIPGLYGPSADEQ